MRDDWSNYGDVFTRRWVVEAILDLAGYNIDADLGGSVLIEPSIGLGAFLVPAVERLLDSAELFGRAPESLGQAIRGYDLLSDSVAQSRIGVERVLIAKGVVASTAKRLSLEWLSVEDFLLADQIPAADFIVGNPPYIRLEDIPGDVADAYRSRWRTMRGRADIYIGFYERGLGLLKPSGRLGFICADRWMKNQYGSDLRAFVADQFAIEHVWVMHDVDAFEVKVSAYPAITVLSKGRQRGAVVANTSGEFGDDSARQLAGWALRGGGSEVEGHGFTAHRMDTWFKGSGMWPSGTPSLIALVENLNERFPPLSDSVKVGIGVATGADHTYVVKGANVEDDRLLPLSMVGDLHSSGRFDWNGYHLVNPWTTNGDLVDLLDYPLLKQYLEASETLRGRHVAKKNPAQWFRTIDKIDASLKGKPKLLIQDMRSKINPVLERGGYYPHHNLYFMTSDVWDLEVLGGILIGRIGQGFVEAYGVRMRGGTLRFQSQYLKKIRLPRFEDIDPDTCSRLRAAFRSRDIDEATLASAVAYDIDPIRFKLLSEGVVASAGERQRDTSGS